MGFNIPGEGEKGREGEDDDRRRPARPSYKSIRHARLSFSSLIQQFPSCMCECHHITYLTKMLEKRFIWLYGKYDTV